MKKGLFTAVFASAMLGAISMAYAGAYGEAQQPEEIPTPAPPAPVAPEPEAPIIMREFSGFLTDAETTRGLRAELGTMYAAEYHPSSVGDVDATHTYLHIAYGKELFEVGLLAPYEYVNQDGVGDSNNFGDLSLWGKILPLRTDIFTGGLGLIATFPTAGSVFGTEAYGFQPFLTLSAMAGPASIRLSGGYKVNTNSDRPVADDAYDYSDLNLAALMPIGDRVVIRGELTHNHFMRNDADPVSFYPGADITFPLGSVDLILRPTLGIGLTEAPDWQLGLGIAVNVAGI